MVGMWPEFARGSFAGRLQNLWLEKTIRNYGEGKGVKS